MQPSKSLDGFGNAQVYEDNFQQRVHNKLRNQESNEIKETLRAKTGILANLQNNMKVRATRNDSLQYKFVKKNTEYEIQNRVKNEIM